MDVNSLITKDYRKKDDFAVPKNKPKTNPIKPHFYQKSSYFQFSILLYPADGASFVGGFKLIFGTVVEISDETMS